MESFKDEFSIAPQMSGIGFDSSLYMFMIHYMTLPKVHEIPIGDLGQRVLDHLVEPLYSISSYVPVFMMDVVPLNNSNNTGDVNLIALVIIFQCNDSQLNEVVTAIKDELDIQQGYKLIKISSFRKCLDMYITNSCPELIEPSASVG